LLFTYQAKYYTTKQGNVEENFLEGVMPQKV
jgi:hypothetical protein